MDSIAKPPISIAAVVLATLLAVSPVLAVDVRQPDEGSHFHADLVRAYAPCLAPNTTAFGGEPACSPAVTSVCGYDPAHVHIQGYDKFPPLMHLDAPTNAVSGPCDIDDWLMQFGMRLSAEQYGTGELPCSSGRCTFHDIVFPWQLQYGGHGHFALPFNHFWNGNVEISAVKILDGDGVPIVTTGVSSSSDARLVSNLTVPYPACPDDQCDIGPWPSPCDYSTGEIEWTRDVPKDGPSTAARMHATLRNVTGSSPLCATGTYQLEATVRQTVYACGTLANPVLCTLVDQPLTLPLAADGRHLDADALVPAGSDAFRYRYDTIEVFDSRLLDPTGAVVATTGVTGVRPLPSPSIVIKGSALKLRASIDINYPSVDPTVLVDPTLDYGVNVTLSDRDGVVYQVLLPADRWQVQPPVGTRWDYLDTGGILGGVRKARLKRVTKKGVVLGYRLDLVATDADLSAVDFPGLSIGIEVMSQSTLGGIAVLISESHRSCKGVPGKFSCK